MSWQLIGWSWKSWLLWEPRLCFWLSSHSFVTRNGNGETAILPLCFLFVSFSLIFFFFFFKIFDSKRYAKVKLVLSPGWKRHSTQTFLNPSWMVIGPGHRYNKNWTQSQPSQLNLKCNNVKKLESSCVVSLKTQKIIIHRLHCEHFPVELFYSTKNKITTETKSPF